MMTTTRKARTMKRRLMRESRLGADYTWNVISTCDQNGLQAIADEEEAHILIYDPNGRVWATQDTMSMADTNIWKLVESKKGDGVLWRQTMMPAKGEKWEQFKAEWNALCGVENEYPYQKTPKTDPIADEVAESRKTRTSSDQGMNELVVDWYKEAFPTDTDMFEDMEETGSTFVDVWDALDNGEDVYAVIGADDSIVRERVFGRLAELTGKDYDVIYNMWLGATYDYVSEGRKPSKDFMDKAEKFRKRWRKLGAGAGGSKSGLSKKDRDHLDRLKNYHDDFGDSVNGIEAQVSEGGFKPIDSAYLDANDPDFVDPDEEEGGYDPDSYDFQDRWERRARKAEKMGKRVCWRCDSIFKPEGDEDMCPKCREKEEQRMMSTRKPGRVSESHDNLVLNPCPKCGGEAKFETVDDFPWVGGQIECADCGHHVYEILSGPDETRSRDEMMDILIDMWNNGDEKRMRTFDEDIDNPNDWSASEDEVEVQWLIDDEVLGIEAGSTETVVIDLGLVDSFEDLVDQATMELKHNHDGMLFDYDVDWVFPNEDELLKRFGYSMD